MKAVPSSERSTQQARLIVSSRAGLHARSAALIVRMAQRFEADIEIAFNGKHASAKSLLSLLILSAEHGAVVTASAVGRDAKEAINAITGLFKSNFHEVPMSAPAHAS